MYLEVIFGIPSSGACGPWAVHGESLRGSFAVSGALARSLGDLGGILGGSLAVTGGLIRMPWGA